MKFFENPHAVSLHVGIHADPFQFIAWCRWIVINQVNGPSIVYVDR